MTASLLRPDGPDWQRSRGGLFLPTRERRRPVGVGLFAGAGGFDLGFTYAGFHMAAAVEFDRSAAATYLVNLGGPHTVVHTADGISINPDPDHKFGTGWIGSRGHHACPLAAEHERRAAEGMDRCQTCQWEPDGRCTCAPCVDPWPCDHFWLDDVRNITGAEIVDALGMQPGEVDVVIGGPPCQGYSTAGNRDVMDPRNSLVFEFARLVREIAPKSFVLENVPGMISMITPEGVPVIDAFSRQLSDGGYGDYQTLRRALHQQAGAAVGTGWQPNRATNRPDERADADAEKQLDLFGGAS